jgi:hypothetical protein
MRAAMMELPAGSGSSRNQQPVRLAGGWWLVLIYSERKVLVAGLF